MEMILINLRLKQQKPKLKVTISISLLDVPKDEKLRCVFIKYIIIIFNISNHPTLKSFLSSDAEDIKVIIFQPNLKKGDEKKDGSIDNDKKDEKKNLQKISKVT